MSRRVDDMADPDSPNYHPSGHARLNATNGYRPARQVAGNGCGCDLFLIALAATVGLVVKAVRR
ncbi:MAG TPA: hypothetical protein VF053_02510 [Streptosporangiales bacterium]